MKPCASCSAERVQWLDYCPPPPLLIHTIGDENKLQHNVRHGVKVLETIRSQRKLIADFCARGHVGLGVPEKRPEPLPAYVPEPAPVVEEFGQLDIFDAIGDAA